MKQNTFNQEITIEGVGLHSGVLSKTIFRPAPENSGIVFVNSRLPEISLPALYSNVVDTRNCTCLGKDKSVVSTIEHLMAALYVAGIDNALIEVSNTELPILDGSAQIWYQKLCAAQKKQLSAPRKYLRVLREVEFDDGKGACIKLSPYDDGLYIDFMIDFPSKIIGKQEFHGLITEDLFTSSIAFCRTFCEKSQIDYLQSLGLIKGGSLDNALVVDGDTVLNPDGMKNPHECVNHKVLDAIGDLYTSGYFIIGKLSAIKTGHFHNNELLKKLFADKANYELV